MQNQLRQRDIFWFWLPLFASWLLMTGEGPIISAAINRLPNEVIMLAAQGIAVSLSVTIQSPVMNLLATSTAVVKDRASFELVRRFTIHWMISLTAVTLLVAFTPVFDVVVRGWLETPPEVAQWVRPALQIMTLWSAAIAWRRFLQGVLISFNQTRQVAIGTVVRLGTIATMLGLLVWLTRLPGVLIGVTALIIGVVLEAVYATFAVRPLLRTTLAPGTAPAEGAALTYGELFWFHLPLAGTAVLILLVQPLVTFTLARLENPTESLAAWPVLFQIMLMARAAALALPEVVIAFSKQGVRAFQPVRRFSLIIAAVLIGTTALFVFTPAADYYLFVVQDMETSVGQLVKSGLAIFLLFPTLTALNAWLRGLLINARATTAVNWAMGINLLLTGGILAIGLANRFHGLPTAAVALTAALLAETIYLAWRAQHVLPNTTSLLNLRKSGEPLAVGD